jgi:hypothetical protein
VAVVLTIVQAKQIRINIHKRNNTKPQYKQYKIQSSAPDDGRKYRPKHVEPTWNNKVIYIVHIVGYFHR